MIKDAILEFSDGQALTSQGAVDSTNVIDLNAGVDGLGSAKQSNPGESGKIWLFVRVTTLFTSAGAATLATKLQDSADNVTFADTELETGAIALATLVAGYSIFRVAIPAELRRYLKLVYTVAGADFTAGAVDAWLGHGG
jgi:hypothetical protein